MAKNDKNAKTKPKPKVEVEQKVEEQKVEEQKVEERLQGIVMSPEERDFLVDRIMDSIPTKSTTRENINIVAALKQLPLVEYIKPKEE